MIAITSYLDTDGGWSRHAKSLAAALARHERTELVGITEMKERPIRSALRRWQIGRVPHSVGITLGGLDYTAKQSTRYRVAFSVAETTRIPHRRLLAMESADMVWSLSSWERKLLESNGVPAERIRVVPAGVDTTEFAPAQSVADSDRDVFRFLCVGKWEERKGTADLVRAFMEEFDPTEPVELVLHCGTAWTRKRDFRAETEKILAEGPGTRARVVASDPCSRSDYLRLLQSSDAFVLPTRAEAWGLPIQEAMACGLPCLVTDYSGITAYANESNAFPIRVQEMVKVSDPEFFSMRDDWGVWAQPDLTHLRQLMRYVVDNPEVAKRRGLAARRDVERFWTWERAAVRAMEHISELRSGLRPSAPSRGPDETREART